MGSKQLSEKEIFNVARLMDAPDAIEAYLEQACGDNRQLRARILQLLGNHKEADSFLEESPVTAEETMELSSPLEREGETIGRYKLLQQIGEGGFGVVYMAEQHRPVRRKVALKVIKPGMDTKEVIGRFEVERQALAMMDHPNIAKVLDAGTTQTGRPYFVMELVRGVPITEYCDDQRFGTPERLDLFIHVCHAVQHAHQKGIIHRDLKPSNVLITEHDGSPVPKVIDFGVAKAINQQLTERTIFTRFQQMVGTPMYMSPEQAHLSGLDIDTRTDIYSLGVLLYELLTGTTPFDKRRFSEAAFDEIRRIIREEDPPKPSTRISSLGAESTRIGGYRRTDVKKLGQLMRGELDWIVMKALEKERGRRYATANSLSDDISRYLNHEAVEACPPSRLYRIRKFIRRYRGSVAAAAMVVLCLCLGLVGTSVGFMRARSAEKQAGDFAIRNKQLADKQTLLAGEERQARGIAERQLRIATSMRLAAQAQSMQKEMPVRSVLLASEAVAATRQYDGDVTPLARETLLNSSSLVGGIPFRGHELPVVDIEFAPDGRWLASASDDGTARVWDVASGLPGVSHHVLRGHSNWVRQVGFTSSAQLITTSFDGTARIWDLTNQPHVATPTVLSEHEGWVTALALDPAGRWLATGGKDGTVRLWDRTKPITEKSSHVLRGHTSGVLSLCFSSDGRWLVSGSNDTTGRLWDLAGDASNRAAGVLRGQDRRIALVSVSSDSRWIAMGGDDNLVWLWRLSSDGLERPAAILKGHGGRIRGLEFTADSAYLVTASWDRTARVWDLSATDPSASPRVLEGHLDRIESVAVSPDGRWLATGSHDRTGRVWDLKSPEKVDADFVLRGHENTVGAVAFSPDSQLLATGSWDNLVRVWQLGESDPGLSSGVLYGHDDQVVAVAASPDGHWATTCDAGGRILLWDLLSAPPAPIELEAHSAQVTTTRFSSNSRWLVTTGADENVHCWDMRDGPPKSSTEFRGHKAAVLSSAFSADSRWLFTGDMRGTLVQWDVREGKIRQVFSADNQPLGSVAVSASGRWLAAGSGVKGGERIRPPDVSSNSTAFVWDLFAEDPMKERRVFVGHKDEIWCVGVSDRWLATGGMDYTARLWDLASADPRSKYVVEHEHRIPELVISSDGRWLAIGSVDKTVDLIDLTAHDPIESARVFNVDGAGIWSLAMSPDGKLLAAGSLLGPIRLWDLSVADPAASSYTARGHEGAVLSLSFTGDGRRLVSGGRDKTGRFFDLDIDTVLERALRFTGRELTADERRQYMVSP